MRDIQYKTIYPFLFAAYPVISLLAHNIEEIKAETALRAFVIAILAAGGMYILLKLLLKSQTKAALLTTLSLVMFFSYGHIYNFLKTVDLWGFSPGRHRLLLPIWVGLFILIAWRILRIKNDALSLQKSTPALNLIGLVLLLFPAFQITTFNLRTLQAVSEQEPVFTTSNTLSLQPDNLAPDIYYIILDAYGRDDTLQELYHLNNRPFVKQLKELGFFVASCSQSNYAQTQLSLASSLNFNYLPALGDQFTAGNTSRVGVSELIHHSASRHNLESLGYTTIAFETGFKGTQWEDANLYLSPSNSALDQAQLLGGINPFEEMLLLTTMGRTLIDGVVILPQYIQPDFNNPRKIHYDRVKFVLEQLRTMSQIPGPKYVFVHLVMPHPPYVFSQDGEFIDYDKPDDPGYQDQIIYLNKILVPLLKGLIEDSPIPPIIIIQGDHGAIHAPPAERMRILNAYYLPGTATADSGTAGTRDSTLYNKISPANTFRLIFNLYFGGNYPMLEDQSYFSVYSRPYQFTIIDDTRPGCQ